MKRLPPLVARNDKIDDIKIDLTLQDSKINK